MIPKLHQSKARNTVKLAKYITDADKAEEVFVSSALDEQLSLVDMTKQINQEIKNCINLPRRGRPPNPKTMIGHLTISFPPGEETTQEQRRDIVQNFMADFGMNNHQWIAAYHTDKPHKHLHVLFNRSDIATHKPAPMSFSKYGALETARRMEQKHNLTIDRGIDWDRKKDIPAKAADFEAKTWEKSFARWATEHKEPLAEIITTARSWKVLHEELARYDIELKPKGQGLVFAKTGTSTKSESMKASDLDRGYSKKHLENRLGAFEPYTPIENRFNQTHAMQFYTKQPMPVEDPAKAKELYDLYKEEKEAGRASKGFKSYAMNQMLEGDYLAIAVVEMHRKMFASLRQQPAAITKSGQKPKIIIGISERPAIATEDPTYILYNFNNSTERPFSDDPKGEHSLEEAKAIIHSPAFPAKYIIKHRPDKEGERIKQLLSPKPAPEQAPAPEKAAAPTRNRGRGDDGRGI